MEEKFSMHNEGLEEELFHPLFTRWQVKVSPNALGQIYIRKYRFVKA